MKTKNLKNRATDRRKNERGFTLIETTISLIVMMVGALACSSLFVFSMQNNVGGSERALAMAVAQHEMEKIRSVNFEDISLTAGTETTTVKSGTHDFSVEKIVADETNAGGSPKQLKRITIRVTPQTGGPNWTRTPVVLVSLRSSLAKGSYLVSE